MQLKEIEKTWTRLKFINPKLKTLNNASFKLNKEYVSDTSFSKLTSILIVLTDRVGIFKRMNVQLQLSQSWLKHYYARTDLLFVCSYTKAPKWILIKGLTTLTLELLEVFLYYLFLFYIYIYIYRHGKTAWNA